MDDGKKEFFITYFKTHNQTGGWVPEDVQYVIGEDDVKGILDPPTTDVIKRTTIYRFKMNKYKKVLIMHCMINEIKL